MDPEALAGIGITVHIIKGYGDTAVAECAIGLLFAAARGFAAMDRGMRAGQWLRSEGRSSAARRSAWSASAASPPRRRGWPRGSA